MTPFEEQKLKREQAATQRFNDATHSLETAFGQFVRREIDGNEFWSELTDTRITKTVLLRFIYRDAHQRQTPLKFDGRTCC